MGQKPESAALESRVQDALRLAANGGRARFLGFLNEREALEVQQFAGRAKDGNTMLWGGYPGAERVMFGVFPDFMQPDGALFPITPVTAVYRKCDRLSHRNFLGALLHAGIERSALGDILVEEGRCVFFCRGEISGFLLSQITKIGGVGVRMTEGTDGTLPAARHFEEWTAVIASARLDCAVAAAARTSRQKAVEWIRSGLIQLNHEIVVFPSETIQEGDQLSVRGKGRFVLDQVGPFTKKDRLILKGRKYL